MYNHCEKVIANRTAREAIDRLDELQAFLTSKHAGQPYPVYITEVGWPTAQKPCAMARETSADNLAQFILWSAATPWLKGVWAYELKDQVENPNDLESNFGLYDVNYQPKPAACAAIEANKIIKSSSGMTLHRPFDDLFIVQAQKQNGIRLIAWTSRDAVQGKLAIEGNAPVRISKLCREDVISGANPTIGATPVVIDIDAPQASVRAQLSP